MVNYFGIDFGTTNSAVAAIIDVNGERIGNVKRVGESEEYPLPSFVAIHKLTGEVKTGRDAKRSISEIEEYKVFSSIKTIIDTDQEWQIAGKIWTPVDIAAELFKALKKNVSDKTDGIMDLNRAVVAVPVGFSPQKKNNIRRAAKQAGISVVMFVSEPTAAYCSRIDELRKFRNIAVFDWGGGTLDIAVIRVENNIVSELETDGIKSAGNDIDKIIAEKICSRIAQKKKIDFSYDDLKPEYKLLLLSACEDAKCDLADEDIANISVSKLDAEGKYGRVFEQIDYDYFSQIIDKEIENAVACLLKTISKAGLNRDSLDCIICEGGSSRLRPLQSKLMEYFDRNKLMFPRKAMWDIGIGAAEISHTPGCYMLNKPIGIIQSNNEFYPLLKVGQRVPTEEKKVKFGVVEMTSEARFILSDGEDLREYFPVKLRGFDDEVLEVSCYIDADMVFRMKIQSNRMPDDVFRVWTYSNLKLSYEIDPPKAQEKKREEK